MTKTLLKNLRTLYHSSIVYKLRDLVAVTKLYEDSTSYSQSGEDRILQFIFVAMGNFKPAYLDVGANHPTKLSNSFLFYRHGASGVCIEPNPILCKNFKKARPRDICLNIGIGEQLEESLPFYCFGPDADCLSSFSKETADSNGLRYRVQIERIIPVPLRTLNSVVEQFFGGKELDLLTIDVEGLEFQILESFDFESHAPVVICAETHEDRRGEVFKNTRLIDFILSQGYRIYADTYLNTIFIRADRFISI